MPRVRAPELPADFPWLNFPGPLSLRSLRGRVVLLDFWTYGCINCLHVLPDLHTLEQRYGDRLQVIGIHTGKFSQEQHPASVEQAIARYGIRHPVVVDQNQYLWDQYAIKAWPTLVLIDPAGYVVAQRAGEGHSDTFDRQIGELLAGRSPDSSALAPEQPIASPLAFPGKVAIGAIAQENHLFVADTGHHRLVIATLEGKVRATVGSGTPGYQDGPWETAQFRAPQGLTYDPAGDRLYVADTGNHLIRCVHGRSRTVTTLAGTGQQNRSLRPQQGRRLETPLNSPWDVALKGDRLFIAMAGSHQIWVLSLTEDAVGTLLGTGAEACIDGTASEATFAQPSGLAIDGDTLYVADSESSSVRAISLADPPSVQTLCGSGGLFDFGDREGRGDRARLQHCLGLAHGPGNLWIADTYNHKIKRLNLAEGHCVNIVGSGLPGHQDGWGPEASFSEPSGLASEGQTLYIADTNNHAIRRWDWATQQVTTFCFEGLCAPHLCVPPWSRNPSPF